jgi:hypothetical protein
MRRLCSLVVFAAALSAPWDASAGDIAPRTTPQTVPTTPPKTAPQTLNDFIQQRGLGPGRSPLTKEEWCQLAFLAMTSPEANEQTRVEINVMARNRGCYAEAHPSDDEATRAMICRNIPALLSEPGISSRQKLSVMDIARANGCVQ